MNEFKDPSRLKTKESSTLICVCESLDSSDGNLKVCRVVSCPAHVKTLSIIIANKNPLILHDLNIFPFPITIERIFCNHKTVFTESQTSFAAEKLKINVF